MTSQRSNSWRARRASVDSNRTVRASEVSRDSRRYQRHDSFDVSAYSRNSAYGSDQADRQRSTAARMTQRDYTRERKRRKRKKIAMIAIGAVVVLCLGGAGAAFAFYQNISDKLHAGVDPALRDALVATDMAGEPFYVLLMGVDGSSEREASSEYARDQFRSDSIMLTRIDPQKKQVTLVSIHRDTLVDMGEYGQNKINAAHAIGGPSFAVETISDFAGVDISHYAEINFDGFKEIVDALGGVEVNVPMEIDDDMAGGHLDAGLQTLDGDQALVLCRSRHAYDDYGDGDSYRAANQRLVLAAIAKKLLSSDVATMANTITSLSGYVTTDLGITDIIGIAQTMQGLDPDNDIYSAMEPTTSEYIGDVWYEITDVEAWKEMMNRVDQGLPPTEEDVVDEASGTVLASTGSGPKGPSSSAGSGSSSTKKSGSVAVRNGNGIAGAGAEAAERLEALGYHNVDAGNAENFNYAKTVVVYREEGQADEAQEIADALGASVVKHNDGTYVFDTGFLVVLGADWK